MRVKSYITELRAFCALRMQVSSVSASFKHGMTTDTSIASGSRSTTRKEVLSDSDTTASFKAQCLQTTLMLGKLSQRLSYHDTAKNHKEFYLGIGSGRPLRRLQRGAKKVFGSTTPPRIGRCPAGERARRVPWN